MIKSSPRTKLGCRQKAVLRMGRTDSLEVAERLGLPLQVAENLLRRLIDQGLMSGNVVTGVEITEAGKERMRP